MIRFDTKIIVLKLPVKRIELRFTGNFIVNIYVI